MNENARLAALVRDTQVFLLDMDGTVYIGDSLIGEMKHTLAAFRNAGKKIVYVPTIPPKPPRNTKKSLQRLGIWSEQDLVYTSGMATAEYLSSAYPHKKVYLVGTDALKREFASYGVELCEKGAEVCVLAYDTVAHLCQAVRDQRIYCYGAAVHCHAPGRRLSPRRGCTRPTWGPLFPF